MHRPIVVICLAGALFVGRALHYAGVSPHHTLTASVPSAGSFQDSDLGRSLPTDPSKTTATSPGPPRDPQITFKKPVFASVPPKDVVLEELANLKRRLRLAPIQIQYWPAVESALRNAIQNRSQTGSITTEKMQELVKASTPLLLVLNEDQKKEARRSARKLGFDNIASQI